MTMPRPLPVIAVAGALVLGLAACGTTEEPAASESQAAEGGAVSITDSRGVTVELDAPATTVVGTEWGPIETLVSLGVMPVGAADPTGYADYVGAAPLDDSVTDIGTRGEPSIDTIASLAPDLIVATDGLSEDVIAQLEDVAPTIVLAGADTAGQIELMESNLDLLAEATGTADAAAEVMAEFDDAVAAGAQAITDAGLEGARVAVADGYVYEGATTIRPYTAESLYGEVFAQIGLESPWEIEGDEAYGLGSTDVEGLTTLDTDYLAIFNPSDDLVSALESNAVWNTLPVVQDDNVLLLDGEVWSFGGPASMSQAIEVLTAALTA